MKSTRTLSRKERKIDSKILLRVDSSTNIGSGHVIRCLTLAGSLHKMGLECCFVCRPWDGNLIEMIQDRGYRVYKISKPKYIEMNSERQYESWIGATEEEDSKEIIDIVKEDGIRYPIVVDHYGLTKKWHSLVKAVSGPIFAIDDLADRELECEVIIDQNVSSEDKGEYRSLVPDGCVALLGPKYAILRAEFYEQRASRTRERKNRILIYFGAFDRLNLCSRVARKIRSRSKDISISVVAGNQYSYTSLSKEFKDDRLVDIVVNPSSMAELMIEADIAIGAAGTTSWERACVGLPAIIVSVATNQDRVGREIQKTGAGIFLGRIGQVSTDKIVSTMEKTMSNDRELQRMSEKGMALVDGMGASRVSRKITQVIRDWS